MSGERLNACHDVARWCLVCPSVRGAGGDAGCSLDGCSLLGLEAHTRGSEVIVAAVRVTGECAPTVGNADVAVHDVWPVFHVATTSRHAADGEAVVWAIQLYEVRTIRDDPVLGVEFELPLDRASSHMKAVVVVDDDGAIAVADAVQELEAVVDDDGAVGVADVARDLHGALDLHAAFEVARAVDDEDVVEQSIAQDRPRRVNAGTGVERLQMNFAGKGYGSRRELNFVINGSTKKSEQKGNISRNTHANSN